jgi:hypothetical protein
MAEISTKVTWVRNTIFDTFLVKALLECWQCRPKVIDHVCVHVTSKGAYIRETCRVMV